MERVRKDLSTWTNLSPWARMVTMGTDELTFQSFFSSCIGFDRIALHCQVTWLIKIRGQRSLTSLKNWSFMSSGFIRTGMRKSAFRIPKSCPEKESTPWLRGNYLVAIWKLQVLGSQECPLDTIDAMWWFRISKRKKKETAGQKHAQPQPASSRQERASWVEWPQLSSHILATLRQLFSFLSPQYFPSSFFFSFLFFLACHAACRILGPQPGINPWTAREFLLLPFNKSVE